MHGMQRRAKPDMTTEEIADLLQMVDFEIMEHIRKRAETVVRDPKTAESLKPWYDWLCKRPCFHDEYLDVFNQDNVTLVDTEGRGDRSHQRELGRRERSGVRARPVDLRDRVRAVPVRGGHADPGDRP